MEAINLDLALANVAASLGENGVAGKRLFVKQKGESYIFDVASNGFFSRLAELWMNCWGYKCHSDKPNDFIKTVESLVQDRINIRGEERLGSSLKLHLKIWKGTFEINPSENEQKKPQQKSAPIQIPESSLSRESTQPNSPHSSLSDYSSLRVAGMKMYSSPSQNSSTESISSEAHRQKLKSYFDQYEYILVMKGKTDDQIQRFRNEIASNVLIDDEESVRQQIGEEDSNSSTPESRVKGLRMYFDSKISEMRDHGGLDETQIENLRNSIINDDNEARVDEMIGKAVATNDVKKYFDTKANLLFDSGFSLSEIDDLRSSIGEELQSPEQIDVMIKKAGNFKELQAHFDMVSYILRQKGLTEEEIQGFYKGRITPADTKEDINNKIARIKPKLRPRDPNANHIQNLQFYFDAKKVELIQNAISDFEIKDMRESISLKDTEASIDRMITEKIASFAKPAEKTVEEPIDIFKKFEEQLRAHNFTDQGIAAVREKIKFGDTAETIDEFCRTAISEKRAADDITAKRARLAAKAFKKF